MPSAQEMLRHGPRRFNCVRDGKDMKQINSRPCSIPFNVGKGVGYFQKRLQKDKLSLDCRYWKLDHEDSFSMVHSWFVRFYMYDLCMVDSVTFGSGTMDWQLCATVQFRTDSHLGKVQCSNCGNLIRFMPLNVWRCPCASLGAQIMHLY